MVFGARLSVVVAIVGELVGYDLRTLSLSPLPLSRGIPSRGRAICYQGRDASDTATRERRKTRGKKKIPRRERTRVPTSGADIHVPRVGYTYAIPRVHDRSRLCACVYMYARARAYIGVTRRPVESSLLR